MKSLGGNSPQLSLPRDVTKSMMRSRWAFLKFSRARNSPAVRLPTLMIRSSALCFTCALLAGAAVAGQSKPNIILIISDDHGDADDGFMGNQMVKTPHSDRMASESQLYTRGYATPVCSPSLASLPTGKLPHEHGITGNDLASARNQGGGKNGSRSPLARHNPPEELLKKYQGKGLTPTAENDYAMVEWLDQTCGEIDNQLTDRKLADNGWDAALGTRAKHVKLSPYELGIRTPMFVRWPEKVKPHRDDVTLASIIDFAPTMLRLAGATAPADLPGLDLLDHDAVTARETVFVESYTHDIRNLAKPGQSLMARIVISGWSKLIIPGDAPSDRPHASAPTETALFDLKSDPLEKTNIAARNPEELARLRAIQDSGWKLP